MKKLDGMPTTSSCKCTRCDGLLISDIVLSELMYWIHITRCVNCGWVKLREVSSNADTTKSRRTNKLDELELYRSRGRSLKRYRYNLQYK